MIAVGIDLGGTKIEAQVFGSDWTPVDRRRVRTPQTYDALIKQIADLVTWANDLGDQPMPIGLGTAGLINPKTGIATAANLPIHGHPFARDLSATLGRHIAILNDSQAIALSEAVFGAGREYSSILSLSLGTGVSGAFVRQGQLYSGFSHTSGEFGHIAAPAHLVQKYALPVVACGCGQIGCIETLISGAGLSRIAKQIMAVDVSPEQVIASRADDPAAQQVWEVWCALTADLLRTLMRTFDPDCFVLGGGLSAIPDIAADLTTAADAVQFTGFEVAPIRLAKGGETSGARGAAYAAWQAGMDHDG